MWLLLEHYVQMWPSHFRKNINKLEKKNQRKPQEQLKNHKLWVIEKLRSSFNLVQQREAYNLDIKDNANS